jgi:hypothetical protein
MDHVQCVPLWTNGTSQVPLWACASQGMRLYGRAPPRADASMGECLYGRVSASMGTLEDQIHMPPGLHWTQDVPPGQCLYGQECLYGQVIS